MAIRRDPNAGLRVFVLILLVTVLFFGGLVWFDYLGIVNAREQIAFFYSLINKEKGLKIEDKDNVFLLEQERYHKMKEALDIKEEELNKKNEEIDKRNMEMKQRIEILDEKEKALSERENSFNVRTLLYENRIANLEQSSRYLTGMPPVKAKDILLQMDDQDIIDILRVTERISQESGETSLVAYWLSLMPPERSASIKRKMTIKPNELGA
ncbi:MAG: flagellar protein FlbB [Spirochaetaceae bacterium]|nr:flagellar protein FlbB [Spirochaetaceae bacterium]